MDFIKPTECLSRLAFYLFGERITHGSTGLDLAPQACRYLDAGSERTFKARGRDPLRNHALNKGLVQSQ